MNDEDFDKLCNSLELAIAHASGEEVEGIIIHHPKKEQAVRKKIHVKKHVSQNHNVHDSLMTA